MLLKRLLNFSNFAVFLLITCAMGKGLAAALPNQNTVNFTEIKQYANLANAAYQPASKIREPGLLKDFTLSHYGNIPDLEIAYFLATNDATKTHVIAVRGTSNIENAMVDIALKLIPDKRSGVRLHNGFSQAAQAIYTEIKPQIRTDYVINTTGHSLGGAVALILAMYLDVDHYKIGQVVTFGQPKVTNIAGANKYQHLNVIRAVTPKDLVPLVPPFDPVDVNNLDIYWHLGKELILFPDTTYAMLEGVNSMIRATNFTQEPLNENNLKNHQMTLYLDMLDKKIPQATLVPFKHNLNLFNLFGNGKQ